MKKLKSFIENVKQVYSQHTHTIKIVFWIILGIAIFASGYHISANFLEKPTTNSEFDLYEKVVRDIYEHVDQAIYEVPGGVSIEITNTSITISSAKETVRGEVIANLQNGEFVFTRNAETGRAISTNILVGFLFILFSILIWTSVSSIYEKIKKRK